MFLIWPMKEASSADFATGFSRCFGAAVVDVQCEQVGAEHTALGGSCVQQLSGERSAAKLNRLGSVCEGAQSLLIIFLVERVLQTERKSTNRIVL